MASRSEPAPLSLVLVTTREHGPGVGVGDGVGDGVGVGVGVGVEDAFVQMINETDSTMPESATALSLTFSVHVPFGFRPSKTDRGLFGVNVPLIPKAQTFSIGPPAP